MGEKELEIKRVRDSKRCSTVKEKGCIINSYRVLVLIFLIVIVTSGWGCGRVRGRKIEGP